MTKKNKILRQLNPLFLYGIAHRGLHNDILFENSIASFKNAIDKNMAFELDVHLSKDNKLIVSHDSNLTRVTGRYGIIEELSEQDIKQNFKLKNGDAIPSLNEVLALNNEKVPMVIELKIYRHNQKQIVKALESYLKNIKSKKNFMIISFNPIALLKAKRLGFVRNLLVTKNAKWTYIFRNLYEGVDLHYELLSKKVLKYKKNHFVNTYTIDNISDFNKAIKYTDTVTFEKIDYQYVRDNLIKK